MKLLRLTTESNTALFDNEFRDNIIIKKNSKIALENVSLDTVSNVLEINGQNNQINYQITTGYGKNIVLNTGSYTKDNFTDLFTDFTNRLNNNVIFTGGSANNDRRELGVEWRVLEANQRINIQYDRGVYSQHETDWTLGDKVENKTVATRNSYGMFGFPSSIGDGTLHQCMLFPNYVSQGNGFIRCRLGFIDDTGEADEVDNGFFVGLSTIDLGGITPTQFELGNITYGVFCGFDGGLLVYKGILNGVLGGVDPALLPTFNGGEDVNNDYLEVGINGNKVEVNIYKNATGNVPQPVFNADYTPGQKLFPFIAFGSGSNYARVNNVRLTPTPFTSQTHSNVFQDDDGPSLGRPTVPASNNPSENFFQFDSIQVAEFLGFKNNRIPQVGFDTVNTRNYIGDFKFEPTDISDAFLVEMLNLKLDSFDGFKNQRKNLLAVIPKSNQGGEVIYEPSNLLFIDLNNEQDVNLRNIRLRVVKNDYTPIDVKGLSSITLLIKDPNE